MFTNDALPELRENGWRVSMSPEFRFDFIEIDDIQGIARQGTDGWFDLFQRDRRWQAGAIDSIPDEEGIELKTDLWASGCGCGRHESSPWCAC